MDDDVRLERTKERAIGEEMRGIDTVDSRPGLTLAARRFEAVERRRDQR